MRLFPEIRVPFGRRAGNTGSPLADEIDFRYPEDPRGRVAADPPR